MSGFKRISVTEEPVLEMIEGSVEVPINRKKTESHLKLKHLNRAFTDLHGEFSFAVCNRDMVFAPSDHYVVKAPAYETESGNICIPRGTRMRMDKNHTSVNIKNGKLSGVTPETMGLAKVYLVEDIEGVRDLYTGHDNRAAAETAKQSNATDKQAAGVTRLNAQAASLMDCTSCNILGVGTTEKDHVKIMEKYRSALILVDRSNLGMPSEVKFDSIKYDTGGVDAKGKEKKKGQFPSGMKAAVVKTVDKYGIRAIHIWRNYISDMNKTPQIKDALLETGAGTNENTALYYKIVAYFDSRFSN